MDIRPIDANALERDIREYADITHGCGRTELANGILKGMGRIKHAPTLSLNTLREAIYQDAVAHGLWEEHDYYYSQMKSVQAICPEAEIDVAMEEKEHCARLIESECYELAGASEDAELYAEELADVIIMSMSVAGKLGIDIDAAIRRKMEINKQRPWKHGKEEATCEG